MSKILLAWEFGGGLGHVAPLRAIGAELVLRGHTVAIATVPGNIELCRQAFSHSGVEVLPVPALPLSEKRLKIPCTFSDTLHDCGYSSAENVTLVVGEWLKLLDRYIPDLTLADYSPSALLASGIRDFKTATIGTGFLNPPNICPLPSLRSEIPEPHWAEAVEQTVLDSMNAAIAAHGGQPLQRVAEVFANADRQYLLTFEELDPYAQWRKQKERGLAYWCPVGALPGPLCDWPKVPATSDASHKVFVYLRNHPSELPLLQGLAYKQISTISCSPHMSKPDIATFANSSVQINSTPIDLRLIAKECSVAVLNGGHGTVCEFLRAGVPLLLLPLMLEQQLTAQRLKELRVGECIADEDLNEIGGALERLLEDPSYKESARNLGQRYADVTEKMAITRLVDDLL